jgi:hypothetical protein
MAEQTSITFADGTRWLQWLKAVEPAVNKDRTLPTIDGVVLRATDRHVELEATDGHKLARLTVERAPLASTVDGIDDLMRGERYRIVDVKRAMALAKAESGVAHVVHLERDDARLSERWPDTDRVLADAVPAEDADRTEPLFVNPVVLADAAKAIDGWRRAESQKTVGLQFTRGGKLDPVRLTWRGHASELSYLIMPMRS